MLRVGEPALGTEGDLMRISEFATQLQLYQLCCIHRRLPQRAQEALAIATQNPSAGRQPPRPWAYLDGDRQLTGAETSPDEI
jgi:hypothetical protein